MVCFLFHFDLVKKDLIDAKNIEETNCREELKDQNNWHFRCCDKIPLNGNYLASRVFCMLYYYLIYLKFYFHRPLLSAIMRHPNITICICLNKRNFREFLNNLTLHVLHVWSRLSLEWSFTSATVWLSNHTMHCISDRQLF